MEEELASLECPFNWNIPEISWRLDFLEKLTNNQDQMYFLMNGFCVRILECFERARAGEIEVALKKAKECELELEEYKPIGINKSCDEYLFKRSSEALWHIILSTKAYLAFKDNDLKMVDSLMGSIKPAELFDDSNKAAILGIKCRFLMEYGPFETTELGIKYIRKAIELDDTVSLWHFYLGKCLARHRRSNKYYDRPSSEEIIELERAFWENQTPDKAVMLLESYGELIQKHNFDRFKSNNLLGYEKKVQQLLNFIQNSAGDEWYIYWRCAVVAMKLPEHLCNKTQIKTIIDKAISASDKQNNKSQSFLCSIQSKYYKYYEGDYNKALSYSLKAVECGDFPSHMEVLWLKNKLNQEEDLLPIIDDFLINKRFPNDANHNHEILLHKANYLLFVKNEVHEAMKIYLKVMNESIKHYKILNCRPLFSEERKPYNVLFKIEHYLRKSISECQEKNEKETLKEYLNKIMNFQGKYSKE